jgi:endonuclease/exonuclease/phosphatase (EEP) superfamily protein YafD
LESSGSILKRILSYFRKPFLFASVFLLVGLFFCFLFRPDFFALITFYPAWIWALLGILLSLPSLTKYKRTFIVVLLGWLIFISAFVEESKSLARGLSFSLGDRGQDKKLRVVSLNCAGGNLEAAEEILQYNPDIVLLQESPTKEKTEAFAYQLFQDHASLVWGIDTSIIVRGRAEQVSLGKSNTVMTQAHIWLASGSEIEVISIRLSPPTIESNLFSPYCWKRHIEDRRKRRSQVEQITDQLKLLPEDVPVIAGGDFNVTANDGSLRQLKKYLRDSFSDGGIGWGHTAINNIPLFRVDQIWVSRCLEVIAAFSKKTVHSDHRMVICDLEPISKNIN